MVTWENTFHETEQAKPEIAILPIGSIEQHSYHRLPWHRLAPPRHTGRRD
jgi:creatinine amidohydrolase/Fe(II)-dependent formamide hydrolase-like protein